jgi:hypothetical protein
MDTLWNLDWRVYPVAVIGLAGVLLMARGIVLSVIGARTPLEVPGKNLTWMRGFRLAVIGFALAGLAAGWMWQWPVLVALSLCVAFEEFIETSIAAWALQQEFEAEQTVASRPH